MLAKDQICYLIEEKVGNRHELVGTPNVFPRRIPVAQALIPTIKK